MSKGGPPYIYRRRKKSGVVKGEWGFEEGGGGKR